MASQTLPEVTLDECNYVVDEDGSISINVINKGGAGLDVGKSFTPVVGVQKI